jgi:hypothetical protein
VRRKGIGTGRTTKTAPVERKEGGYKAPVTLKGVLRHALLTAFDDAEMVKLAVCMPPHTFRAGDVIVEQGEVGASMVAVRVRELHCSVLGLVRGLARLG